MDRGETRCLGGWKDVQRVNHRQQDGAGRCALENGDISLCRITTTQEEMRLGTRRLADLVLGSR